MGWSAMDRRTVGFLGVGLAVVVLLGVVVSQFASGNPDGLEYVAEQEGFLDTADDHTFAEAPLADYGENLTDNGRLNTAIAGLAGIAVTLLAGYGIFWVARRTGDGGGDRPSAVG